MPVFSPDGEVAAVAVPFQGAAVVWNGGKAGAPAVWNQRFRFLNATSAIRPAIPREAVEVSGMESARRRP